MGKRLALAVAAVCTVLVGTKAQADIVYANSPTGDDFTNAGTTNMGLAIGATGWYYNNVRNNGHVGINDTFPRSGDGSVWFEGTQGPSGNSSKGDLEYLPGTVLGTLGTLNALSYDWYRSSSSTNSAAQHPVLRLYIDADGLGTTTNDRGYLVYEGAYNGFATAAVDSWQSVDVFNFAGSGQSANLWMVRFGVGNQDVFNRDINDWLTTPNPGAPTYMTLSANTMIYGISAGFGSGWGPFEGAVDNITIGFQGSSPTTYNFEMAPAAVVPLPSAAWAGLGLLGAMGVMRIVRRRPVQA